MQKQIDSLLLSSENQREQNERLNNELTDLIEIHQIEMSAMRADIKTLEERLLYKFNDYWNELLDRLDKLDTRVSYYLFLSIRNLFVMQSKSRKNS